MNLGQLTTRLNGFQGLDLTPTEARDLLNEGCERFALRSQYPRKVASIGPTVAQQEAYSWPADLLLPVKLTVAGRPWAPADPGTVEEYERGLLRLGDEGVWYEEPDAEGGRAVHLYPVPQEEAALILEWVFKPAPLVADSDEPVEFPSLFHDGLVYEAAAVAFEGEEDNVELANYYTQKAEGRMRELMVYDNIRRSGSGVFRIPIVGVTAR